MKFLMLLIMGIGIVFYAIFTFGAVLLTKNIFLKVIVFFLWLLFVSWMIESLWQMIIAYKEGKNKNIKK